MGPVYVVAMKSLEEAASQLDELLNGFIGLGKFLEELPEDFENAIYRHREHYYRMQDAITAWERYSEEYLPKGSSFVPDESDYENLVERFEDNFDCNVDENYQWEFNVEQFCIESDRLQGFVA